MKKSLPGAPRANIWRAGLLILLLGLALDVLLAARRPDPAAGQEQNLRLAGALDASHVLEQTFTPSRPGLAAVEVFARVPPGRLSKPYRLTLRLRRPGQPGDIAVLQVPLARLQTRSRVTFAFPAQLGSAGVAYLLRAETDAPPDTISLLASAEDIYPGGELRLDGQPAARDLTLRTFSAPLPGPLAAGLRQIAPDFALLLLVTLLLGGVGASALALLTLWPGGGWGERGLWAVGLGLALAPLAFLLLGQHAVWLLGGLLPLALARAVGSARRSAPRAPQLKRADAALLGLFLWSLALRLLQVQDAPLPLWTDGLAHYQMAQELDEAGRILPGLLYHTGFHSLVVLLHRLTGLPLERLIVLLGQWASAFSGPALYVLAARLFRGRAAPAALLAALVLSMFPSLPGYLINWGRYPFLLGLALLPFALAAALDALPQPPGRASWRVYLRLGLLLAGMVLCHYGTLSFWVSFSLLVLLLERPAWLKSLRPGRAALGLAVLLALAAGLAALRFGDSLWASLSATVAESRLAARELSGADILQINLRAGGLWLWVAGLAGAVWAGVYERRALALSAGWFAAQAGLVAAQSPLLGYALASYANLLLALALPLTLLAGGLLAWLLEMPRPVPAPLRTAVFALLLACGLSQLGLLNPATLLASDADLQAAAWLRAQAPARARVLINSSRWSVKTVPSDGGGWLPALTGREVVYLTAPPAAPEGLLPAAEALGAEYVYLGRFPGLLTRALFAPPEYQPVYHQGGVVIYQKESGAGRTAP